MTCPICGGAVRVPPLDALVLRLIDGRGLSENAEAFLRLLAGRDRQIVCLAGGAV